MQNIKKHSVLILIILITLLGALGVFQFRWDLTSEKRYTLSDATIKTLKNIKKPLKIEVYLEEISLLRLSNYNPKQNSYWRNSEG